MTFTEPNPLDDIISMRDHSAIESKYSDLEGVIDLHQNIAQLSPRELAYILGLSISQPPNIEQHRNYGTKVVCNLPFGNLQIISATPEYAWNEEHSTDDLCFVIALKGTVFVNNVDSLYALNRKYDTLQLLNNKGKLSARTKQTLKGGRTVENLLWAIIQFTQDCHRVHKDLHE